MEVCSPCNDAFSISFLIILPPGPVPISWEKSIPFFSAKRRASGDMGIKPVPKEGFVFLRDSSGVRAFCFSIYSSLETETVFWGVRWSIFSPGFPIMVIVLRTGTSSPSL
jgi:hypothetical protein